MFPIGTVEVIDAYRHDLMQAADEHRARAFGAAMTRPFRRLPNLHAR